MNLYKIQQSVNHDYDTYDNAVVCTGSEESARLIHPSECKEDNWYEKTDDSWQWDDWALPKAIKVTFLGVADKKIIKRGVICASFNAG